MSENRAEIRKAPGGKPTADPHGFVLAHHRAGEAELSAETLTGGHLLHLAVAGCVFNSVFRLAAERGIALEDCRVSVDGGFGDESRSTGISYEIELSGAATAAQLEAVARNADADSTIPNLLRASSDVELRRVVAHSSTAI